MSPKRFESNGSLHFPEMGHNGLRVEPNPEHTVVHACCPNGHDLVRPDLPVGEHPGIWLSFTRPGGGEGEVVLSPVLGCLEKRVLSGEWVPDEEIALKCPVCRVELDVLCGCEFHPRVPVRVLYLSEQMNIRDAIAICSRVGCPNSSYRKSGEMIRAIRGAH
jgi:hypothetical protein